MKRMLPGQAGQMLEVDINESSAPLHCHYLYHNRFEAGPQYVITPHDHLFWHVEIVGAGHLVTTVADQSYDVRPGEAILLPPEWPHGFVYRDEGTYVFSVKFEVHNASLPGAAILVGAGAPTRALADALDSLLRHQVWPSPEKLAAVDHLLAALVHLAAHMEEQDNADEPKPLAQMVKELVERTDGKAVTVGGIARQLGYSETHVRSQFHKDEGMGLKEYIDRHRANVAVQYLSYSDMPIKEIVTIMEFPDPQCFSRFCKRMTGRSPKMIRRWLKHGTNVRK
ncbi:MAG: helix-turn-helix domain-containing protein [Chitinivibrionales bacterium]|nr:helix-turn-helix domain-containing protein [Chitinivibrionales bacterium]